MKKWLDWARDDRWMRVFALCLLLGLLLVGFAWARPHYTATITRVGTISKQSGGSRRYRRRSGYKATVHVTYTDKEGRRETAEFMMLKKDPDSFPSAGDEIEITPSLAGMTPYPSEAALIVGGMIAGLSALFAAAATFVERSKRKKAAEATPAA
ncbi:MAG: hypothetical protein IJS53_03710 [Clostridia bacterium]|nr:hypothetical protein [Clostridia bacterium]